MRRGVLVMATLALLGATSAAGGKVVPAETTSVAPSMAEPGTPVGFPILALLTSTEGLPTDSFAARTFVAAFRGAFIDEYFLTERTDVRVATRWAERSARQPFSRRTR